VLAAVAARLGATPVQVALAWLLDLAPNILLIPGTRTRTHLTENLGAAGVRLDDAARAALTRSSLSRGTGPGRRIARRSRPAAPDRSLPRWPTWAARSRPARGSRLPPSCRRPT
jgi:diketogulonate reductase-like aldo/keto reductase